MNGCFLIAIAVYVLLEAIPRFVDTKKVDASWWFIGVAGTGLVLNTLGTVLFGSTSFFFVRVLIILQYSAEVITDILMLEETTGTLMENQVPRKTAQKKTVINILMATEQNTKRHCYHPSVDMDTVMPAPTLKKKTSRRNPMTTVMGILMGMVMDTVTNTEKKEKRKKNTIMDMDMVIPAPTLKIKKRRRNLMDMDMDTLIRREWWVLPSILLMEIMRV